ncbi:MAG: hypothetical protein QOH17_963, partial [Pseudonocardiales bacterium]|nr:hypothetical protein [Pseudonocardiales bacterium]
RGRHAVLERIAARGAAITLGASPDLVGRARRAGAVDARFLPVVAPPLPAASRAPAEVRRELGVGERPLVLVAARLAPQKRLDLLVDATAGWADEAGGPMVVVAGAGPLADALVRRAERARSPVVLLGHRDDPADLLAAADLTVLPSEWEARPLVIQEALRAGVPVLATDVGGVRDLVGDAAVLVPAGDVAALRQALRGLLDDPGHRAALGARGQARSLTLPSVADMVDGLLTTYAEVPHRRPR